MKKEIRIRLLDILIGLALAATAGLALAAAGNNAVFLCQDLFVYGDLEAIRQNPFRLLFVVRMLVPIALLFVYGILGLPAFVRRRPGRDYIRLGRLCLAYTIWTVIWYAFEILSNVVMRKAYQGTLMELSYANPDASLMLINFAVYFLHLGYGILLIVYGKKLLPAWLEQGALVASGPFPYLRELGAALPALGLKLKQAWLDMRERNRMP